MADETAMAMADVPMSKRSNFDLDFMHYPSVVLFLNHIPRRLRNESLRAALRHRFIWSTSGTQIGFLRCGISLLLWRATFMSEFDRNGLRQSALVADRV